MIPRLAVLGVLVAWHVPRTGARPEFVARIPNADLLPGIRALGHVQSRTGDGGPRNAFGLAFQAAGFQWTEALCQADADGDGQTNGQELGDPCCVWHPGEIPTFRTGIANPTDAASRVNASILYQWACALPPRANDTTGSASYWDGRNSRQSDNIVGAVPPGLRPSASPSSPSLPTAASSALSSLSGTGQWCERCCLSAAVGLGVFAMSSWT